MSTITAEQQDSIRAWLEAHPILSVGIGTREQACSVAAINLALTGTLTDDIPECMSEVVGYWIIAVQDEMPAEIRNSPEWRSLLPLAAGTGRVHEDARREVVYQWMIDALARIQHVADIGGFGKPWAHAVEVSRNSTGVADRAAAWAAARDAARAAAWAAAGDAAGAAAGDAAWAAAGDAAGAAAGDAAGAAAGDAAGDAAGAAAGAAAWAAAGDAAGAAAGAAAWAAAWAAAGAAAGDAFHRANDYPGLLRKLIEVGE